MFVVRCRTCNREITGTSRTQFCGCENQMQVTEDSVTAVDLSNVVLIKSENNLKKRGTLTEQDLIYQEQRRKRKVRKLTFEER